MECKIGGLACGDEVKSGRGDGDAKRSVVGLYDMGIDDDRKSPGSAMGGWFINAVTNAESSAGGNWLTVA